MRITIEHYNVKCTAELSQDSDITDVLYAITGALIACGWSPELIENHIKIEE